MKRNRPSSQDGLCTGQDNLPLSRRRTGDALCGPEELCFYFFYHCDREARATFLILFRADETYDEYPESSRKAEGVFVCCDCCRVV